MPFYVPYWKELGKRKEAREEVLTWGFFPLFSVQTNSFRETDNQELWYVTKRRLVMQLQFLPKYELKDFDLDQHSCESLKSREIRFLVSQ